MKNPSEINVLIACEESQAVCIEFRKLGFNAFSCDILECSGGHPEWHIKGNALEAINIMPWDLIISHPPCTWLCQAMRTNAARKDRPKITSVFIEEREKAHDFFMKLYNAPAKYIAVENPVGYMNQVFRKPDQIIRPWMHGHPYRKDVCIWLKNLPLITPTNIVDGRMKLDFWSTKRNVNGVSLKSKTFPGIAKAMAEQWGNFILKESDISSISTKQYE